MLALFKDTKHGSAVGSDKHMNWAILYKIQIPELIQVLFFPHLKIHWKPSKSIKIISCRKHALHDFSSFSPREKNSLETQTKSKPLLLSASEPHTLGPTLSFRQGPWMLPIFRLTSTRRLSERKGVSSLSSTSKNLTHKHQLAQGRGRTAMEASKCPWRKRGEAAS